LCPPISFLSFQVPDGRSFRRFEFFFDPGYLFANPDCNYSNVFFPLRRSQPLFRFRLRAREGFPSSPCQMDPVVHFPLPCPFRMLQSSNFNTPNETSRFSLPNSFNTILRYLPSFSPYILSLFCSSSVCALSPDHRLSIPFSLGVCFFTPLNPSLGIKSTPRESVATMGIAPPTYPGLPSLPLRLPTFLFSLNGQALG